MKISSSQLALGATHVATRTQESGARLSVQRSSGSQTRSVHSAATQVGISAQARQQSSTAQAQTGRTAATPGADTDTSLPAELQILKDIIEAMTGQKLHFFAGVTTPATQTDTPSAPPPSSSQGWSVQFDSQTVVEESESTQFAAAGQVTLSDGRSIAFTLGLTMQRDTRTQTDVSVRAGDPPPAKDPLVLSIAGATVQATGAHVAFNLTGTDPNALPVLAGGGYLVWDRNNNGKADNGSELFGPQSGDGFADLAALDADHNGWIDSADPAFAQLKLWQPQADGSGSLKTLSELGVGALYTGKVATPFTLKDATQQTQGAVRSSGVYLNEDGSAGALQQIDVVA